MPAYRIQSHTRHKSAQVVTGYILAELEDSDRVVAPQDQGQTSNRIEQRRNFYPCLLIFSAVRSFI